MNPAAESSQVDLRGRRVLVVDDDRLNLLLLGKILQPEGYEVVQANSGESALERYAATEPDLVVLDVVMPGINGFETCREMKRRFGDTSAPVIFITAKTESEDVLEGLAAGGVDYLPKPFRPRETLARIRVHLQNRILMAQQRKLVDQLSAANTAKNRLLGMVAHDLRNPLSTMRGLSEFLRDDSRDGKLTADQGEIVESIYSTSESMLTMVNELLDTAVIESGEIKIHPKLSSLSELLETSVTLNNINAAKKGSKIVLNAAGLPGEVHMDCGKIKQVVDNLISNAIKFSPPSSLVTVEAGAQSNGCTVAVIDQGPGIPDGEHDKLFKDFSQTSVKPTAGEKSTGLGLAICRRIVEAHGGSISAQNRREGGCAFMFSLPLSA